MRIVAVAWCALLLSGARGNAQDVSGPVAVEIGGAAFVQAGATGTEGVTYVTAPGGMTLGVVGAVAVRLPGQFATSVELGRTGAMRAVEPSR